MADGQRYVCRRKQNPLRIFSAGVCAQISVRVTPVVYFISERADFACKLIAVDIGQISTALTNVRCLKPLPTALGAIEGQTRGDRVRVKLRVQPTAGVMTIQGHDQIPVHDPHWRALSNSSGCPSLQLSQRHSHSCLVSINQPAIFLEDGDYRY